VLTFGGSREDIRPFVPVQDGQRVQPFGGMLTMSTRRGRLLDAEPSRAER
jgi:hypothetical protein